MNKRSVIIITVTLLLIAGGWCAYLQSGFFSTHSNKEPIKVGILHSLTGTMSISEKPVVDSTLFAIDEINRQGGVLGRMIEPVVVDGQSDIEAFTFGAENLIVDERVSVVFGCWTSASRKAVKPIFERYNNLLFYPVQFEGLESSQNIIYTGATPNQQIIPAVKWCFKHLGRKFLLVGSDYVFPRISNIIIKDLISALGGDVVGEEYLLLGSKKVQGIIEKIKEAKPDVILNTINGDSNISFFSALRDAGITSDVLPTMSFSIGECELQTIGTETTVGDYACWNYFQSINTQENKKFVDAFKDAYGQDRVISDPMEAAYFGVRLWAQAVNEANTVDVNSVRASISQQSVSAPEGVVHSSRNDSNMVKYVRIGRVRDDGQFRILWTSNKPRRPVPYPNYRIRVEWDRLLHELYDSWGHKWVAK